MLLFVAQTVLQWAKPLLTNSLWVMFSLLLIQPLANQPGQAAVMAFVYLGGESADRRLLTPLPATSVTLSFKSINKRFKTKNTL